MSQQFCLKWNNHMNNMMDVFKNLLSTESMVDVTLACDGLSLKAHKMVLSACSPFFQSLFLENPCKHPIVILKDMKYSELKAIIEFMYHGEVNVAQDQLSALMKTAETLRVKGLAEVTNEKSSSSSAQDEPGHRSVPRTETPPPQSKRRRGRVRKRSLSDSNRSDDSNEPKIKQPVSPDIEELSGDITMDNSSGQFSNLQSQVPMQSLPSHSTNSYHKSSSVVSLDPQIEEPASADESEFGVEPAKLLEQTLTTDDLSNRRGSRASTMSSGMEMSRRPRSSTDHSSIVPVSMPSESMMSNQPPESPPDIKPELLELEPPMSPVAGPSHSTDNSMMMYMDQSSVSSHPGTSYQDNQALVSQDSQPQGFPQELRGASKRVRSSSSEGTTEGTSISGPSGGAPYKEPKDTKRRGKRSSEGTFQHPPFPPFPGQSEPSGIEPKTPHKEPKDTKRRGKRSSERTPQHPSFPEQSGEPSETDPKKAKYESKRERSYSEGTSRDRSWSGQSEASETDTKTAKDGRKRGRQSSEGSSRDRSYSGHSEGTSETDTKTVKDGRKRGRQSSEGSSRDRSLSGHSEGASETDPNETKEERRKRLNREKNARSRKKRQEAYNKLVQEKDRAPPGPEVIPENETPAEKKKRQARARAAKYREKKRAQKTPEAKSSRPPSIKTVEQEELEVDSPEELDPSEQDPPIPFPYQESDSSEDDAPVSFKFDRPEPPDDDSCVEVEPDPPVPLRPESESSEEDPSLVFKFEKPDPLDEGPPVKMEEPDSLPGPFVPIKKEEPDPLEGPSGPIKMEEPDPLEGPPVPIKMEEPDPLEEDASLPIKREEPDPLSLPPFKWEDPDPWE